MTWTTAVARCVRCVAVALTLPCVAAAQTSAPAPSLYMPRAMQQAYAKGTRSPDGRPGPALLAEPRRATRSRSRPRRPNRTVRGTEQIVYVNNSPDTLPRARRCGSSSTSTSPARRAAADASADYLTSGVHIDAFAVNGAAGAVADAETPSPSQRVDAAGAAAAARLRATRRSTGTTTSRSESGREGMIDSTTFFLAYFYPRVAVYDDYNGWDTMAFTDRQEFYSDFNDYDVTVQRAGQLRRVGHGHAARTPPRCCSRRSLQRFQRVAHVATQTIRVATASDMRGAARHGAAAGERVALPRRATCPTSPSPRATTTCGTRASVVVDDATAAARACRRRTTTPRPTITTWCASRAHALDWLSRDWPGVPYPYEKTTVVQGFAGMEYPMMANDESYADTTFSRFVAEHEIAHTYFPFYMGINETRYAFMDEGMGDGVRVSDRRRRHRDGSAPTAFFKQFRVEGWINDPSPLEDLPIITPADVLRRRVRRQRLRQAGARLSRAQGHARRRARSRRRCTATWTAGTASIPSRGTSSTRSTTLTGRNLDWFWQRWFFDNGYIDLGIASVTRARRTATRVVLDNVGGMPAPVDARRALHRRHERDAAPDARHLAGRTCAAPTVAIPTRKARAVGVARAAGSGWTRTPTNDRWPTR